MVWFSRRLDLVQRRPFHNLYNPRWSAKRQNNFLHAGRDGGLLSERLAVSVASPMVVSLVSMLETHSQPAPFFPCSKTSRATCGLALSLAE